MAAGPRQIRAAVDHIEYSGMLLPSRERPRTVRISWMYVASRPVRRATKALQLHSSDCKEVLFRYSDGNYDAR